MIRAKVLRILSGRKISFSKHWCSHISRFEPVAYFCSDVDKPLFDLICVSLSWRNMQISKLLHSNRCHFPSRLLAPDSYESQVLVNLEMQNCNKSTSVLDVHRATFSFISDVLEKLQSLPVRKHLRSVIPGVWHLLLSHKQHLWVFVAWRLTGKYSVRFHRRGVDKVSRNGAEFQTGDSSRILTGLVFSWPYITFLTSFLLTVQYSLYVTYEEHCVKKKKEEKNVCLFVLWIITR